MISSNSRSYQWFRFFMTLLIALVFLSDTLKGVLIKEIYDFLKRNRDFIIGLYYIYIVYDIYINNLR